MPDTSSLGSSFNTAQEQTGSREIRRPIPRDPTAVIYIERWAQAESAYSVTALDTEHPSKTGYFLVDEQIIDRREDLLIFERTYATVPASRNEPVAIAYTFPGWFDGITLREPQNKKVRARAAYAYFKNADPTHATTGITVIQRQRYIATDDGGDIEYINAGSSAVGPSSPSITTYLGWISAGTEIVAEDSEIRPYYGNIWERVTFYILPQ